MNRDFAHLGFEHEAFYAYEIAYIEEFLENSIIKFFIVAGADVVTSNVHLYASPTVLNFSKRRLAHNPAAHQSAGNGNFTLLTFNKFTFYIYGICIDRKFCGRIGFYSEFTKLLQTLTAHNFLF